MDESRCRQITSIRDSMFIFSENALLNEYKLLKELVQKLRFFLKILLLLRFKGSECESMVLLQLKN